MSFHLFFQRHFSYANAILLLLYHYIPFLKNEKGLPLKIPMIASPRIRIIILSMHPRRPIIPSIHIPMPIRPARIHPFTMMSLRPIRAVVHVLVIRACAGVVRGAPVPVVVGRCAVRVVVGVAAVAATVACGAVASGPVAGSVVVGCTVAGCTIAGGVVACGVVACGAVAG